MSRRKTICGNCKHWGGYRERALKVKPFPFSCTKGEIKRLCRRFPPQVITSRNDADWPHTGFYWHCGEFTK